MERAAADPRLEAGPTPPPARAMRPGSPWGVLVVALSALQATLGLNWVAGMYRYVRSANVFQSDFTAFYTAARMTTHGQAHALFDLASQQRAQEAVRGVQLEPSTLLAFVNPPFVGLAVTPFGWLPYRSAYLLFFALQLVILAITVRALLDTVAAAWTRTERVLLAVGVVTSVATLTSLSLGSLAVIALLAATRLAAAVRTGRHRHAGVWLVLLAMKPQLALLVVLALVALRCWRILGEAVAIGAAVAALATLVYGAGVWTSWLTLLRGYGSAEGLYGVDAHYMWNLRGALVRSSWFSSAGASRLSVGALMISALIVLWGSARTRREGRAQDLGTWFATVIALTVLTATHCNRQDTTLLLLAAALLYDRLREHPRRDQLGCVLIAGWLGGWIVGNSYDGPAVHPVTVLALGVALAGGYVRHRDRGAPDRGAGQAVERFGRSSSVITSSPAQAAR